MCLGALLQGGDNVAMAAVATTVRHGAGKFAYCWIVGIVARAAAAVVLEFGVGIGMALGTVGDVAVFVRMTAGAAQHAVGSGRVGHLLGRLPVALVAGLAKAFQGHAGNRGMGVLMALQALAEFLAMGLPMAVVALGNAFFPAEIALKIVVAAVATTAGHTVFAPLFFQSLKHRIVALGALFKRHLVDGLIIRPGQRRRRPQGQQWYDNHGGKYMNTAFQLHGINLVLRM